MIIFKCDTCQFTSDCETVSKDNKESIPSNWISINIKSFHNDKDSEPGKRLIYSGNSKLHFCSNNCFKNHFFYEDKNEKQ